MIRKDLRRNLIASILLASLFTAAHAQEGAQPVREKYVVDEVVAVVGSSAVMLSDLKLAEMQVRGQLFSQGYSDAEITSEALESLLLQKLLLTQAGIDSLEASSYMVDAMAESRLNELIEFRGSVAAVEAYYNKPIFAIKDILKDRMREDELASTMQRQIGADISVTPSDVRKFYKTLNHDSLPIVPEQYIFAKVAITPSLDEKRKLDVKEELLGIRSRIIDGASFAALARLYSDDLGTAVRGGELEAAPSSTYTTSFKEAVEDTPIGQISGIIETEYGYHILEVLEEKDGLFKVRHILMKINFDAEDRVAAINKLDSVANEINSGSLDFERAVELYSTDEASKINNGRVINSKYENYGLKYKTTYFYKEELGIIYDKIKGLAPGEVSSAFEYVDDRLEESIQIVKLLETLPAHPANIDDDYNTIEEMALAYAKQEEFNRWLDEKLEKIYVYIEKPYQYIELKNPKWRK